MPTPSSPSPRPVPAGQIPPSVAFLLSRLGYEVGRELSEALAGGLDLGVRQFGLLRLLADSQGHSQRALGELLRITPNRMVALVDDLQAKGLIERRPHPEDRRAYAVSLTPDGSAALESAFRVAMGVEADTCSPLDPQERAQLLGLLTKLARARDARTGRTAGVHPGMLEPEGN